MGEGYIQIYYTCMYRCKYGMCVHIYVWEKVHIHICTHIYMYVYVDVYAHKNRKKKKKNKKDWLRRGGEVHNMTKKKEVHKESSFFFGVRGAKSLGNPWSHCAKGISCDDSVFFCGYIYF